MMASPGIIRTTGADAIVECLRHLQVERVFGVPGVQNMELFDALADAPFSTFTPTNESAAVFMADAYARVTGKVGVAVVTAGPGLTNALTGIAEAYLDSSPLLVLVGTGGGSKGKAFGLHGIPHSAVVGPLVKGCFKPAAVEEVSLTILQAAALACRGEGGPVLVEIPSVLLMDRADFGFTSAPSAVEAASVERELDDAAGRLRRSAAVGIYAGAGAFEAAAEVKLLAERLQAPVATTISGRGVLPEDHPLSVGYGFGRSGTAAAYRVFRKVETLLAVGCKYGETATGAYGLRPPREHIHIDVNPGSIGANYATSLAIVADAKRALGGLLKRLEGDQRPTDAALQEMIRRSRSRAEELTMAPRDTSCVGPGRILRVLRKRLERDAILVADSGAHQFWALSDFPIYSARSFLAPADYQSMGFSIPAAISAKLACPGRQVVSLVGDGGFLMSALELLNAVRWGAGVVVVVFRDGAWGLIKEAQQRIYRRSPFTAVPAPDFQLLARSLGVGHVRIGKDSEIDLGLTEALACKTPAIVEVDVDYTKPPLYVEGAGPQMFRNLPLRLKAGVAFRLVKRRLLPPAERT